MSSIPSYLMLLSLDSNSIHKWDSCRVLAYCIVCTYDSIVILDVLKLVSPSEKWKWHDVHTVTSVNFLATRFTIGMEPMLLWKSLPTLDVCLLVDAPFVWYTWFTLYFPYCEWHRMFRGCELVNGLSTGNLGCASLIILGL